MSEGKELKENYREFRRLINKHKELSEKLETQSTAQEETLKDCIAEIEVLKQIPHTVVTEVNNTFAKHIPEISKSVLSKKISTTNCVLY